MPVWTISIFSHFLLPFVLTLSPLHLLCLPASANPAISALSQPTSPSVLRVPFILVDAEHPGGSDQSPEWLCGHYLPPAISDKTFLKDTPAGP